MTWRTLSALIVVSQLQNYRALATETILRSGWRVWCPVNHRWASEEKMKARELAEQSLILLQVDELGDAATALWNAGGSDPKILIRTSSVEAVRSLVATGAGCSVLPDILYRPWSLERRSHRGAAIGSCTASSGSGAGLAKRSCGAGVAE